MSRRKLIALLFLLIIATPVMTSVVFYFGWSNKPHSWPVIILGTVAAFPVAVFRAVCEKFYMDTKLRAFLIRTLTHVLIFSLSCVVIIYGWGMQPQRWWVIIGGYLIAKFLPPFNQAPGVYTTSKGEKL